MIILFAFIALLTASQSDYLNQIKAEQDAGAEWNHIQGGQPADPNALRLFDTPGYTVYYKLKD